VRRTDCSRYALKVSAEAVDTSYGPIPRKTGTGYGLVKSKPEYEVMAKAAQKHGVSLTAVQEDYGKAGQ